MRTNVSSWRRIETDISAEFKVTLMSLPLLLLRSWEEQSEPRASIEKEVIDRIMTARRIARGDGDPEPDEGQTVDERNAAREWEAAREKNRIVESAMAWAEDLRARYVDRYGEASLDDVFQGARVRLVVELGAPE